VKDFDAEKIARNEEDLVFKVNGVSFKLRPAISARRIAEYEDEVFGEGTTAVQTIEAQESLVADALEPGQEDAWRAACRPDAPLPLQIHDLERITNHLRIVLSGRPLGKPPGSGGTPETTGTTSTGESP